MRLTFLFILLAHIALGQQFTATIKGRVSDKDSKQPLQGVNIMVLNTNPPTGAVTAEDGSFTIDNVSVGRQSIRFSYLGYDEVVINEILIRSGKETVLNVEMQEKVSALGEVEITAQKDKTKANNEFAAVSVRSFSAEEMNRYAGTLNDPARMAQSFAGVMTANDENNQIVVRGNSPRGLLWRMEGVEIPNPNHFAGSEGSTGGGVSMLSSNMLTNTDFLSGAFPGEYGNALSGVFDLNLRKGNSDKHEFTLQAGVLGLEAALEGPFSKKYRGSYLINYRYSTLDILGLLGLKIGGNVLPKYQDVSFNFFFPTKKIGSFTLFGMGGLSSLGEKAERDTALWETLADKSEYNQAQKLGVIGMTHLFLLKDNKTYIKSVASYSYTNNGSSDDTLDYDFNPFRLSQEKFIYQTLRAAVAINTKINSRNIVRVGAIYTNMRYRLFSEAYSFLHNSTENLVDHKGSTNMAQAYAQWKHRFSERFQISSGVHFTFAQINNKFYAEPRLSAEWKVAEQQSLTFGTGVHSRIDAISTYVSYRDSGNIETNRRLEFSRSLHAVLGYNLTFLKQFHLKAEVYVQYLFQLPVGASAADASFSIINYDDGFVNVPLQSTGKGYNYGLELTFEKFFSKHYYFVITASLFDSKYMAMDGKWRNTAYNVNYVLNALGGKEFVIGKRKNNIFALNAKVIWRGGQRITPIDLPASIVANETVYQNDKAFTEKLPDYFRIDFGMSYRRNKKKYSWTLSFDAQNIINRQNVARKVYNPETQQVVVARNLGIVPVVSYKVEFSIVPKAKPTN